ncbi:MAG: DUF2183 domain-containing protein [Sulfitobacter sp.]|nr:DUF2183 domain-containing protein [Sulfitobacter sp.]
MLKDYLHRALLRIEALVDRLRGQRDDRRVIEPYIGYATPEHRILRGRVLTTLRRTTAARGQSRWMNLRQMLGLFLTNEVSGVTVTAGGITAKSDEEGYFTLLLPRGERAGWHDVPVHIENQKREAACPVMVARTDADFGLISDIDDTMMETGAYSLLRNLYVSFTGNALTRKVYPDAIRFTQMLSEKGRNPVYYVSSSPWNLHHFLRTIFDRAGLVRGPKFLRDLGLGESQFITGSHGDHKGSSIDAILAANPNLRFVLAGDTGQHDAHVYRDAINRHPGRILAVVLREPGPGPDAESRTAITEMRQAGVTVLQGPRFDGFAETILDAEGITTAA